MSGVRDCLFNIFAAAYHIGGRSSIRNLRTLHSVVTGTHLSCGSIHTFSRIPKHVIPRKPASCKSAGSMRTERLDESYVRSSLTNTYVSVSRHTTITFSALCFMYFLSFMPVYRHCQGTHNSCIQIWSVSVEQQVTTGTGSKQTLRMLAIWGTALCRGYFKYIPTFRQSIASSASRSGIRNVSDTLFTIIY